jgi:hypothetical protein
MKYSIKCKLRLGLAITIQSLIARYRAGHFRISSSNRVGAGIRIGGELTQLRGDLAHRVTESRVVVPELFRHLVASFCVRSALFG